MRTLKSENSARHTFDRYARSPESMRMPIGLNPTRSSESATQRKLRSPDLSVSYVSTSARYEVGKACA